MALEKYSLRTIKEIGRLSEDGVVVYSLTDSKVKYCNEALGTIFNKNVNELANDGGRGLYGMLKDDKAFLETHLNQLMSQARILNLELRVYADYEKYISVDAYFIAKNNIIIAFVKEITRSKEHFNYIVEFGARKNTILDMIAHNLSGPLNLTNNLLDMIDQASRTQQYKAIETPARLIRENTQECIDLINSFLREEHFASPKIASEASRFDVVAKISMLIERYKQFAPAKQIKMLTGKKQLFVTGDDVKFFQVVNNIISNAVKYTDVNGIITIEVAEANSTFRVCVSDNGIGIPEYLQPHLFKKNTPTARPGLRGEKATGMGLYIVRKLVDIMNGSLTFNSEENKGSTFCVEFPKSPDIPKGKVQNNLQLRQRFDSDE
jgi:two-component system sensor histidine kinase VicK